ncbi:MAG: phosphoribosyltransferase family protein [Patescibacteria group bacterium]
MSNYFLNNFFLEVKKIFFALLDYVWPRFCLGCGREGSLCCQNCVNQLLAVNIGPKPWPEENFHFTACYVCLDYHQRLVQKLIKHFKYKYLESLASILAMALFARLQKINLPSNTIITNIPLHPRKARQRGFDQTQILAMALAKKTNLVYWPLLSRKKYTKTQAQLNKKQRQTNVADAFVINKKIPNLANISKNNIILIDDVATTGATLDQAAKILKQVGFKQIICLVLAKN